MSNDFVNGQTSWESNTLINSLLSESLLNLIINKIINILSDLNNINTWLNFFNGQFQGSIGNFSSLLIFINDTWSSQSFLLLILIFLWDLILRDLINHLFEFF